MGTLREPSHLDGSFEHPKHIKKQMGKQIITILCSNPLLTWTYDRLNYHMGLPIY